ncbi:MAG TPA: LysR substrate-binding domain-containing protein, partial [Chondromyces sp.]|nr:LysR substrate-binding domain-containing protein [Chondromyces sp.]
FKFWQGSNKELREFMERGEIDLALISPVPESNESIHTNILFSENMRALVPRGHRAYNQESINLRDLKDDPFVLFRTGFDMRKLVIDACQTAGFEPKVAFESEDIYTIKGLVEAGLGVSLLPETALADYTPTETISLPITMPRVSRTVGVMVTKSHDLPPSEKLFYEFLISYYERLNKFSF